MLEGRFKKMLLGVTTERRVLDPAAQVGPTCKVGRSVTGLQSRLAVHMWGKTLSRSKALEKSRRYKGLLAAVTAGRCAVGGPTLGV